MQNEPNLQNTQINVTSFLTRSCGNFHRLQRPKNEPKTNPICLRLIFSEFMPKVPVLLDPIEIEGSAVEWIENLKFEISLYLGAVGGK